MTIIWFQIRLHNRIERIYHPGEMRKVTSRTKHLKFQENLNQQTLTNREEKKYQEKQRSNQ